jgi:glycosyltransferase involved in cell wall biosynthesis
MIPVRTAFVLEQTLGHVTHAKNLRRSVDERADIVPTWLPISFPPSGLSRILPLFRSNWSVRASWRARIALERFSIAASHDALVFHTQVTALFSVGLMRALPTVVSLDATPMNYDVVGASYGHKAAGDGPIDRRKYLMNRAVFNAAAGLVTWSEWARRSLIHDYGVEAGKIRVLAPGASSAYFDIGDRRDRIDTAGSDPIHVLFVGGDFERKGGSFLLDCLGDGMDGRCVLHLVTQADVPESQYVRVYRGVQPNSPELLRLYHEADLFVLPSRGECLAVVLMEATAAGLPVITTDVGALREAVVPGESGIVVRAGDPADLKQALLHLVGDAQLRRSMGRAGHRLARQKFDAHKNNQALLDIVVERVHAIREGRRAA